MKLLKNLLRWVLSFFIKDTIIQTGTATAKQEVKLTNKQKRDLFLYKKGYTVPHKRKASKKKVVHVSAYNRAIKTFYKLKRENKINIKSYRNKWGVPFYDLKKTPLEQLSVIS